MTARASWRAAILGIVLATAIETPVTADPTPGATPSSLPSATPTAIGASKEELKMAALATSLLMQAQTGEIDRSMLEAKMNLALSPALVMNVSQQLAPLGKPTSITFVSSTIAGAYTAYKYRIAWDGVAADESFALNSDGKIVAWRFQPAM